MTTLSVFARSFRSIVVLAFAGALVAVMPTPARAQGCVVARLFTVPYALPGAATPTAHGWQVSATYRYFHSFRDFQGSDALPVPAPPELFASTRVSTWDINARYGVSRRLSISFELPIQHATRESAYEHDFVTHHTMSTNGPGDLKISGQYWLRAMDNGGGNVAIAAGLKLPTGSHSASDTSYRSDGTVSRPVDPAIQLGDGGIGIILSAQGYAPVSSRTTLFAQGTYLLNPRETNGTQAPFGDLPDFTLGDIGYTIDSVPDQFAARGGLEQRLSRSVSLSLAMRVDGVPVHDLIGGSEGYRLPGYTVALEPGLTLTHGKNIVSWSMPFAVRRNASLSIADVRTGNPIGGIAALADHVLLVNYARRF